MKRFPQEIKDQVLKEVEEVGNVVMVARKHGINHKTVNNWVQAYRNKDQITEQKTMKQLARKIKDQELEIEVLKALLKKTYPHWQSAEKL